MQSRAGRLKAIKNQINPLIGYPSLDINFAAVNEILDPRITFSRTSNATLVGSNGLIQYAPHNLLTYSEQFDNAAWSKSNTTVSANVTTAPDGTLTADRLEPSTTAVTSIYQSVVIAASSYTGSVYVKKGSGASDANRFYLRDSTTSTTLLQVAIDYDTLVITYIIGSTGASVQNVGNGWLRVSLTVTSGLTIGNTLRYGICFVGNNETAGEFAYAWGAQLNEGTLQPYYSTTVKNLLGYSQNFENAAWTKSNSSIASSTVIGPFGFDGGEKLVESTNNVLHYVAQTQSTSANSVLTLSIYAKAGERTQVDVRVGGVGWATSPVCVVNLITGAIVSGSGATVVPVGGGWFRISLTATADGTTQSRGIVVAPAVAGSSIYTGDGTSGIYIFGAQLSDSASLDPYSYNPVAAPTSTAYYGPRFDYDPVTLAPKGLLIEEQRTNLVLNSDALSTQSVTVTAQAYTLSFYGTGTITLSGTSTGSLVGTGAYPSRVSLTFTPTAGTLTLTVTGSVGYAQLEAGAFPTSYIPTTSATVTRAADNASMVGSNFSSWYNQSEGTIYSQWILGGDNTSVTVYNINDTTSANYIRNRYNSAGSGNDNAVTVSSIVQLTLTATNQIALYAMYKNAMAYKQNDFARSANGTLITGSTGNIPVVSQMNIGASESNVNQINGHIQSIKYYPTRLPNDTLQGLTA